MKNVKQSHKEEKKEAARGNHFEGQRAEQGERTVARGKKKSGKGSKDSGSMQRDLQK